MKRLRLLPFILVLAAFFPARLFAASTDASLEYSFAYVTEDNHPAELMLLSPRLKGEPVGQLISAYYHDGIAYLPLVSVASLLEINIRHAGGPGLAEGFIVDETQTIEVDATEGVVTFRGHNLKYAAERFQVRPDDIYIEESLLRKWIPVRFEIDSFASTINIIPERPVPLQMRLEREARHAKLMGPTAGERNYRRIANRYRLFDGPFVDQTIASRVISVPGREADIRTLFNTYVAADTLYLETNAYVAGNDQDGIVDFRVNTGRRDAYPRLLGPLQAREFRMIDVYAPSLALISRSQEIRGALVSNYPMGRSNYAEGQTLRGDLPPGWTVELYQDDYLIDYRTSNDTGLYLFENLPMHLGLNQFTLVFYGPYGQRREESFVFNIADSLPAPGELHYRVAGGRAEPSGTLASLNADIGVLPNLALSTAWATLPRAGRQVQYVTLGARSYVGPVFVEGNVAQSSASGTAFGASARTQVDIVHLKTFYDYSTDRFESEIFPGSLLQRYGVGSDIYFADAFTVPVNTSFLLGRNIFRTGASATFLENRTSANFFKLSATNRLGYHLYSGDADDLLEGGLTLSRNVDPRGQLRVSADLSYYLHPELKPLSLSTRLTNRFPQNYIGFIGFTRQFQGRSSVQAGVGKEYEYLGARLTGRHVFPGENEAFLELTLGLGYVDHQRRFYAEPTPMGGNGAALVRAFVDVNQNGRWDPGEEPVQGASVFVNGNSASVSTGRDGQAFIRHLSPYVPLDVSLSQTDLGDLSWVSANEGVSFVPRPGRITELQFPIIPTGEIDGTVYVRLSEDLVTEQSGIRVQVLQDGRVVDETITAYDGFYLFEKLPYGTYRIRVNPEQLSAIGAAAPPPADVTIGLEEPVAYGNDIELKAAPAAN